MTEAQRAEVLEHIRGKIADQGYCHVNNIPQFMKRREFPDWKLEKRPDEKLYDWVKRTFPEYEVRENAGKTDYIVVIPGSVPDSTSSGPEPAPEGNPVAQASAKELPSEVREKVDALIRGKIEEQGFCWTASLPSAISNWKEYTLPGENFPTFLGRIFPEYEHRKHNGAAAVFPREEAPEPEPSSDKRRARAMQEMVFGFAFIPPTTSFTTLLREMTGDDSIRTDMWKEAAILAIGDYLLGLSEDVLDDSDAEVPRIAFPVVPAGNSRVYAILEENAAAEKQRWKLAGFSVPGLRDETGWGHWLCSRFGLPSEDQETFRSAMEIIAEETEALGGMKEDLEEELKLAAALVREGRPLPETLLKGINQYETGWKALKTAVDEAWLDVDETEMTLEYLSGVGEEGNAAPIHLAEATERFGQLAQKVWQFLEEAGMIAAGSDGAKRDLEAWERCIEENPGGEKRLAGLQQLLAPYYVFQKLSELTPREVFDPQQHSDEVMAEVDRHFGSKLDQRQVATEICFRKEDKKDLFAFLEELTQIERLLAYASSSASRTPGETPGKPRPVRPIPEILRDLETDRYLYGEILAAFPAPDSLERAIMLGDTAQICSEFGGMEEEDRKSVEEKLPLLKQLEGELNAYSAGVRLSVTLGAKDGQAERCFLMAYVMGNPDAARWLYKIYSDADRLEEIQILYVNGGKKGKVDETTRVRMRERLLDAGIIDAGTLIGEDIVSLLEPRRIDGIRQTDPETADRLQRILDQMQEPFVEYVILMSDQMRSYILEQENIDHLQEIGIPRSGAELLERVRSGSYTRSRGVLETARRVYAFLGTWNHLAEEILDLGEDGPDERVFRLRLARDDDDREKMLMLLRGEEALQKRYPKEYADLLYEAADYEEYLRVAEEAGENSLKKAVAALRCGKAPEELPDTETIPGEEIQTLLFSLREDERDVLADAAAQSGDVWLAYALNPRSEEYRGLAEAAVDRLMAELPEISLPEQEEQMHRLEMLCEPIYQERQAELMPLRITMLLAQEDEGADAEGISRLLRKLEGKDALREALERIRESGKGKALCVFPVFWQTLTELGHENDMETEVLRFFHENRTAKSTEFHAHLFRLSRYALEAGTFPEELLEETENYASARLRITGSMDIAVCLYVIERYCERLPYMLFAMKMLRSRSEELSSESREWIQAEAGRLGEGMDRSELSLFGDILADPGSDVGDYLLFCHAFHSMTQEDEEAAAQFSRAYATESESETILHYLYENYQSEAGWELALKLPFHDRPALYARLLFETAMRSEKKRAESEDENENVASAWKRCAGYCEENKLYSLLLTALRRWAECVMERAKDPFPWYLVKGLFAAVVRLSSGELPQEWADRQEDIRGLADDMIQLFERFNNAGDGDANHNSLRTIIEYSVTQGIEDCVTENAGIMKSLYGANRKLCFVLALRLIAKDKIPGAQKLLQHLLLLDMNLPYFWLIRELAEADEDGVRFWRDSSVGQDLMELILPDGNSVNGKKLRELVMRHWENGTEQQGLETLEELLRGGEDCMVYTSMFILCKYHPVENMDKIYRAISGICENYPVDSLGKDIRRNFSRTRGELLMLLLIIRAAMEKNEHAIPESDREFNAFLRRIYHRNASAWEENNVNFFVSARTEFYEQILRMYDGKDRDYVTRALVSVVTGNWTDLLKDLWNRSAQPRELYDFMTLCGGSRAAIQPLGLLRSIFQVMREMNTAERRYLVLWLKDCADVNPKMSLARLDAIANEASNVNDEDEDEAADGTKPRYYDLNVVDEKFLQLPLEEHFLCLGDWGDLQDEETVSCFHWMKEHTPTSRLRTTVNLFVRLAQDITAGTNLSRHAQTLFNQSADEQAAIYYDILNKASRNKNPRRQIFGKSINQCTEEDKKYWKELYQCRSRICGAFSGNETVIARLKNLRSRSAFNIIMTLLTSKRSGEVHRMAGYLRGINRTLALDVLKLVSPAVDEEEKLRLREKYRRNTEAYEGITFLLSRTNRSPRMVYTDARTGLGPEVPLFVRSLETAANLEREFRALTDRHYRGEPVPCYITPEFTPSAAHLTQLDPAPAEDEIDSGAEAAVKSVRTLPAFAEEILGSLAGTDLPSREELEAEYRGLRVLDFRYGDRMALSGKYYVLISTDPEASKRDVSAALIRYGLDYYSYHRSEDPGANPALADRAIREMAIWCSGREGDEEQLQNLTERIPIALQRMLGSVPDADALVEDWQRNQEGYSAMIGLVSHLYPFLSMLYTALNNLCRGCINIGGPKQGNEARYKSVYSQCIEQLLALVIDRRYGEEWNAVRSSLITLLQEAQNAADQRPDLSIHILNTQGRRKDAVFGVLMNTGREPADNIVMLMSWSDGQEVRTSAKYTCDSLRPAEKVAFAIDYEVGEEIWQFSYRITVTAQGRGTELNIPPEEGNIGITAGSEPDYPTDLYQSDRPAEFHYENGEIISPGFFGREHQLEELRRCVEGRTIGDYKNRVVQGVRRSGKTSLLNYLKIYCEVNRPDLIAHYVDCQGITHQPIQTVFVKSVLHAVGSKIRGIRDTEEWNDFREAWSLGRDDPDRLQQEISEFYQELQYFLERPEVTEITSRRGVLLIIDEFDVLLQKLGDQEANDLLQTLRKVMSQCGGVIKLIFCGSNNLILYKMDGGRYHQFFQSVDVIVVDDLPMKDLENMLRKPYEGTDVRIPDETMWWVYRYTGGLVWYTKLLGKAMLQQAKADGRSVVYPTDVYTAFTQICNDGNCQQFFEGCGDAERRVLQAMADLSPRYRSLVTVAHLNERVGADMTELRLAGSLARLTELRLIEETSGCYVFRKEIYRRYFRTKLTIPGGVSGDVMEKPVSAIHTAAFGGAFGQFKKRD